MTLRVRLLLGYGYLVALLLAAAASALLGFLELSAGIDEVLEENFRSIRASMRMIESLERQDSATLAALAGGEVQGAGMAPLEKEFLDALNDAEGNVTEGAEPQILGAVRKGFETYRENRDALLASRPERPLAAYDREVFPHFSAVKAKVLELLDINQEAMIEADRRARETAIGSGVWLGFLVAVALVSLVFLSRALQRRVLSRLSELRQGMAAIAAGDLGRRLREEGGDELTSIACQFNSLLDQYEELGGSLRGRLALERRLVVALVGEGRALYGLAGELLAGELGGAERALGRRLRERHRERGAKQEPGLETLSLDGADFEVRLLQASGDRPVGWLAQPSAAGAGSA